MLYVNTDFQCYITWSVRLEGRSKQSRRWTFLAQLFRMVFCCGHQGNVRFCEISMYYVCGNLDEILREFTKFSELMPREVRLMLKSHQSDSSLLDILPLKFHLMVKSVVSIAKLNGSPINRTVNSIQTQRTRSVKFLYNFFEWLFSNGKREIVSLRFTIWKVIWLTIILFSNGFLWDYYLCVFQ